MPKNETLILFFRGKTFLRAYNCWFFIAYVLLSKYLSPLEKVPNHIFVFVTY